MAPVHQIEAQKQRESEWVQAGVTRFNTHCDRAVKVGQALTTTAGSAIMRAIRDRLLERLTAHMVAMGVRERGGADPVLPVLAILGVEQVAALVAHVAIHYGIRERSRRGTGGRRDLPTSIHVPAQTLGEAVEHDVRFREWKKVAKGDPEELRAVARMKKHMEGDPRTWRRRAAELRERADNPWEPEDRIVIGVNLLSMLADAAPDVFKAETIRFGHKTYTSLRMTDEMAHKLTNLEDLAAVSRPRYGMMIAPPVPWQYEERR